MGGVGMQSKRISIITIIGAILALFMQFLPLVISADWTWVQGWVMGSITIFFALLSRILAARRNPDLLAERAHYDQAEGAKSWDLVLVKFVGLYLPLSGYVVLGLDKRFGWSPPFSTWVVMTGLFVLVLGLLLATWAFVENRFFSTVVRIQKDRGHVVCATGPYHYIRHPGYAGGMLTWLGVPFFMGSQWALIPFGLTCLLIIVRTRLEDRTLMEELPGYREFAAKTRYRLLPGIW